MKNQSQIFNPTRFGNCLKRELTLDGRSLLLKWLVMIAGLTAILFGLTNHDIHDNWFESNQSGTVYMVFCLSSFLVLTIGASLFMQNMTSAGSRLNSLMSPCSTLEKYICRWLIYVLGITIMFLSSFAIAEGLRVLIIRAYYGDIPGLHYVTTSEFPLRDGETFLFWSWLLAAQATFVLGSTIAPKNAFLKTVGVYAVLATAFSISVANVFNLTFPPDCMPTAEAINLIKSITRVAPIVWTIFCYIIAYFRMKESEIIERL